MLIIDVDDTLRRHLLHALVDHCRKLRRSGVRAPESVRALVDVLARDSAPAGTERKNIADDGDSLDTHFVSYQGAANILGVSERTIRTMGADGRLPVIRVGRRCLIPVAALHELGGVS